MVVRSLSNIPWIIRQNTADLIKYLFVNFSYFCLNYFVVRSSLGPCLVITLWRYNVREEEEDDIAATTEVTTTWNHSWHGKAH